MRAHALIIEDCLQGSPCRKKAPSSVVPGTLGSLWVEGLNIQRESSAIPTSVRLDLLICLFKVFLYLAFVGSIESWHSNEV